MSIPAYLILGSPSSGRCGVAADAIENALEDDDFCTVFVSANEKPTAVDRQISSAPNAGFVRYSDYADARKKISQLDENKISHVFFVGDSSKDIADTIEAFKEFVDDGKIRLVRIWSVLDCAMLIRFPKETGAYADELSHFADCLILSRSWQVPAKSVSEIRQKYEKLCRPHMFVVLNEKFRTDRPIDLLIDETRRISMYFDSFDASDELDIDEENLPEEPFSLERKPDPYIKRLPNGARAKPVENPAYYAIESRRIETEEKNK